MQRANSDKLMLVKLGGCECVKCNKVRVLQVILMDRRMICECACERYKGQTGNIPILSMLRIF